MSISFLFQKKKMQYHTLSGYERHESQEKCSCKGHGTANIVNGSISHFLALSKYHPRFLSTNLAEERKARTTTSVSFQ